MKVTGETITDEREQVRAKCAEMLNARNEGIPDIFDELFPNEGIPDIFDGLFPGKTR